MGRGLDPMERVWTQWGGSGPNGAGSGPNGAGLDPMGRGLDPMGQGLLERLEQLASDQLLWRGGAPQSGELVVIDRLLLALELGKEMLGCKSVWSWWAIH